MSGNDFENKINVVKNVCFICGSYTSLTINIYEERAGPNIVEIINEKFKVKPIDEDKFLCYSCNNWLINWHSLKNNNDQSNQSQQLPSKSKGSSGHYSSSSSSIPEEQQQQQQNKMVVLSDCQQMDLQKIRAKLQKYFYLLPNAKPQQENRDIVRVTVTFKCNLCRKTFVKSRGAIRQRRHFTTNGVWRFCKSCKYDLRNYFDDNKTKCSKIKTNDDPDDDTKNTINLNESSQSTEKIVNPLLVHKLRQLGTTIMPENVAKMIAFKPLPYKPSTMIQKQNIFKKNNEVDEHHGNYSNDILISFDKTVTEVFPVNLTKTEYFNNDFDKRKNINEVFEQIPKAISISVA